MAVTYTISIVNLNRVMFITASSGPQFAIPLEQFCSSLVGTILTIGYVADKVESSIKGDITTQFTSLVGATPALRYANLMSLV